MTSEFCKAIACPFFGKFSGKAVCRAQAPKRFIKHIDTCTRYPINTGEQIIAKEALQQVLNACKDTGATIASFSYSEIRKTIKV